MMSPDCLCLCSAGCSVCKKTAVKHESFLLFVFYFDGETVVRTRTLKHWETNAEIKRLISLVDILDFLVQRFLVFGVTVEFANGQRYSISVMGCRREVDFIPESFAIRNIQSESDKFRNVNQLSFEYEAVFSCSHSL